MVHCKQKNISFQNILQIVFVCSGSDMCLTCLKTSYTDAHFAPVIVAWRHRPQKEVLSQIWRSHKGGPTFPGSEDVTSLRKREVLGRWRPRRSLCHFHSPQGRMVAVRKHRKINTVQPEGAAASKPPRNYLHMWEEQVCPYEGKSWWIVQRNGLMSLTSFIHTWINTILYH